jgi:cytochrome c556
MKNFAKVGTALAFSLAAAMAATAQPAPPSPEEQAANAIDLRQSALKLLGYNMGPMGGMLRGNVPFDAAVVQTNAGHIAALGEMIPDLFAADTSSFDLETEALDRIWGNKDAFDEKAMDLVTAANAAAEAAASGNESQTKAAMGRVGQACGACHDDYRED